MTAIKHTLQREVFLPSEERLIAVVHVTKEGKKKKSAFLCAAVTTEKPVQASLYQVRKSERGDNFKKKASWPLRQLKVFDAKYTGKESAEFEVHFDKIYRWIASSIAEKNAFIQSVHKLSQMYVVQKPEFINIQPGVIDDVSTSGEAESGSRQTEEMTGLSQDSDWHALSPKEETDLEMMMSQCEFAISNAEAFAEELAKDLSVLDGANIHSIMGSEDQVLELMALIDVGLKQAMEIEEKLDEYEQKLQCVKDLTEIMKDKDELIKVKNKSHQKLLVELDRLVNQLDLDHVHVKTLLDADLCTPAGIQDCTVASKALLKCTSTEIHPALMKMAAVQEQRKRFTQLKSAFAKRLAHHLNNLFIHQGNELGGSSMTLHAQDLKLPQHSSCHRELLPYSDLMNWLRLVDNESYLKLRKVYTTSLNKLYDREIKEFMESIKNSVNFSKSDKRGGSNTSLSTSAAGGLKVKDSSSISSLNRSVGEKSGEGSHAHLEDLRGSDSSLFGRSKFDQMYEKVLSELGPWCLAEQDFSVRFFNLTADSDSASASPPKQQQQQQQSNEDPEDPWIANTPKKTSAKQRQINEEVRKMMGELFPTLEAELMSFETFGISLEPINSLYMLVRMSNHVLRAEDTGSFLSKTYANCLVQIKRNFDKYVQNQIQLITEHKLSKKVKVGILPFVHNFEEFAHCAETIYRGTDRRTDLDKAYAKLISAIFQEIGRAASESQKTPSDVVLFENYHHVMGLLSKLKIASLEAQKKEARQKYQDHLQAYVTSYLGRPMEKVHLFFDGIESKLSGGTRADEIGFQMQFSKQELRKVIKEYPGKEVKRNLEHLCRKIEKHLCEEENLFQVVWHSMQDEFLKQYKYFEDMIAKCYQGSGITFEFTISDLLGYFSDIAQSH